MKRYFVLFLSLVLAVCLCAAGCGEEQEPTAPSKPSALLLGTVYGTVTENGAPLEGVSVTAGSEHAQTDEEGRYSIAVYDDGTTLVFEKAGHFTQKRTFKSASFYTDAIEYSFLMFRIARVSGVVKRGGVPVEGARVVIGLQERETGADGSFLFEEVIATSMILTAAKDGKSAKKPLYTEEMRTGSVSVELELEE